MILQNNEKSVSLRFALGAWLGGSWLLGNGVCGLLIFVPFRALRSTILICRSVRMLFVRDK